MRSSVVSEEMLARKLKDLYHVACGDLPGVEDADLKNAFWKIRNSILQLEKECYTFPGFQRTWNRRMYAGGAYRDE